MNELTDQEKDIFRIMRQLVPYEEIRIVKDKDGTLDSYFVVRTQKILISKIESRAIHLS